MYVKDISMALSLMGHKVDVISGPPYPELYKDVHLIKLPGLNLFETFSFKDRVKKFWKKRKRMLMIIMNSFQYYLEAFLK